MSTTKILIAEDHPLIAKGLKLLIQEICPDNEILETDSTEGLMSIMNSSKPNYCIVDLNLKDGLAMECLENILNLYPEVNVMIYTAYPDSIYTKRLFQMGVHCFLNKNAGEDELTAALTSFLAGEFYVSAGFLPLLLGNKNAVSKSNINPFHLLSNKEMVMIEYYMEGKSVSEIAKTMNVLPNTATTFKRRAFSKLGVKNLVELTALYKLHGGREQDTK